MSKVTAWWNRVKMTFIPALKREAQGYLDASKPALLNRLESERTEITARVESGEVITDAYLTARITQVFASYDLNTVAVAVLASALPGFIAQITDQEDRVVTPQIDKAFAYLADRVKGARL